MKDKGMSIYMRYIDKHTKCVILIKMSSQQQQGTTHLFYLVTK